MSQAKKRKRPSATSGRPTAAKGRPAAAKGRPPAGRGRPAPGKGRTAPGKGRGTGGGAAQGPPVIGKRPSNPGFLAAVALMWFVAAIAAVFILHKEWKVIPVIVFAGIGLLYLRGAAGAYSRREPPEDK